MGSNGDMAAALRFPALAIQGASGSTTAADRAAEYSQHLDYYKSLSCIFRNGSNSGRGFSRRNTIAAEVISAPAHQSGKAGPPDQLRAGAANGCKFFGEHIIVVEQT
jgi:hypothetical protein